MIYGLLEAKEQELSGLSKEVKKTEALQKEIDGLRHNLKRNKEGQLWRNRTQLAFCFRSYITHEEFTDMVYQWKSDQDRLYAEKKKAKGGKTKKG